MSFLDTKAARQDDTRLVSLHEILIRAYPNLVDALAIAGSVGILQADIAVYPKMRHTWWSVLEVAAEDKVLRRLVYNILNDPTVFRIHEDVRNLLDIPETELAKANRPAKAISRTALQPQIGDRCRLWPLGHVIKIRFLDGKPEIHRRVEKAALGWLEYVNLFFDFGDHADAEVRISFKEPGSWSYLGTQALDIPDPQPNMNFGWLDSSTLDDEVQRVVLHEFGHVLGMQHEQGNPASALRWNKKAVYRDLSGPPNHWTRQMVDQLYFSIWPPGYFPVYKVFDPASINIFPIPAAYLREGQEIGWNKELSPLDKQFAAALYPQRERDEP